MKDPKRQAAGRKSRRKGSSNERELAKQLGAWWGTADSWARTPASGGWATAQHREAFNTCGDIITTAKNFPFTVEAKSHEGYTLDQLLHNEKCIVFQWWDQAMTETPSGMVPLLVIKRNHIPRTVVFDANQVEYLCRDVHRKAKIVTPFKLPWSGSTFPMFHYGHRRGVVIHDLLLLSLENFLRIDPGVFGRKVEDVQSAESRAERSDEAPGAEDPNLPDV